MMQMIRSAIRKMCEFFFECLFFGNAVPQKFQNSPHRFQANSLKQFCPAGVKGHWPFQSVCGPDRSVSAAITFEALKREAARRFADEDK